MFPTGVSIISNSAPQFSFAKKMYLYTLKAFQLVEITFLGTGTSQGVPVIGCKCEVCISADSRDNRLRSSAVVCVNGKTFIIDVGPDFRQQMLRESVFDIHAILLTHGHKDHVAGLDDIRPYNYFRDKYIDIYCEKRVEDSLRQEFAYIFSKEQYPGIPKIHIRSIDEEQFLIGDCSIIPIRLMHMNLPILGYRIENFTYITDASYIAPEEIEKIQGTAVLVVNALRKKKHYSHFNLAQTLDLIAKVNPQRAFITHISHQLGLYEVVSKELPNNVYLAYDGLRIVI